VQVDSFASERDDDPRPAADDRAPVTNGAAAMTPPARFTAQPDASGAAAGHPTGVGDGPGPLETRSSRSTRAGGRRAVRRRRRGVMRWVALAVAVALVVPIGVSYARALTAPGTDPLGARTVEWLRDHGLGGVVNTVERWWYTNNEPARGGTLEALPQSKAPSVAAQGRIPTDLALVVGSSKETLLPHQPPPANLTPFVDTPLPDEGVWRPTGRTVVGTPAVFTAFMRPDPVHTGLVAAFMWMDTKLLKAVLVTGLKEPAGAAPSRFGNKIPDEFKASSVVAFNSAFRLDDARGGYFDDGAEVRKLVDGQASLVIDKDGTANVVMWGRDRQLDANVQTVRQNLALVIDGGVSAAGLDSEATAKWGGTVGNEVLVWRSGVGVDKNGGLIYIGGPGLSVNQLAELFLRAGAVRAMELDINSAWVTAYIYEQVDPNDAAAITGTKLLPEMTRAGDRYLVPGERDFVTMLARY
jgi:hypothetical protein